MALKAGKVTWQELNLEQEYIEYENKASSHALMVYDGILARCKDTVDNENVRDCYNKSTMCQKLDILVRQSRLSSID